MSDTSMQSVIDRIKKCLALAERGGTEDEAATAANMAAALAAKYSIDLGSLQEKPRGFVSHVVTTTNSFDQWVVNIVSGVAETYGAKVFFTNFGDRVDYSLILRPELKEAAVLITEYLTAAVMRLNREAVNGRGLTQAERSDFRKSFRLAASMRLRQRLTTQARDMRTKDDVAQATVGRNALVVLNHFEKEVAEMADWMATQGFNFKTSRHRGPSVRSDAGWNAGLRAGDSIGLDPQVRGGSSPKVAIR